MNPNNVCESSRAVLFVPGDRPDRFNKALSAGADLVVLDLEDSVSYREKSKARTLIRENIRRAPEQVAIRVNGIGTSWHDLDVKLAVEVGAHIMLPKVEKREDVDTLALPKDSNISVLSLIETPLGISNATDIASAERTARLCFGSLDFAATLGLNPDCNEALLVARSNLVLASSVAGLRAPIDGVTRDVHNLAKLEEDLIYSKRLGFGGKLCIHPSQVRPTLEFLQPSEADIRWAQKVLRAVDDQESSHGGVTVLEGQMIDAPVVKRALEIVAEARQQDKPSTLSSGSGYD